MEKWFIQIGFPQFLKIFKQLKKLITNTKEFDIEMTIKLRFTHQMQLYFQNLLMAQLTHRSDNQVLFVNDNLCVCVCVCVCVHLNISYVFVCFNICNTHTFNMAFNKSHSRILMAFFNYRNYHETGTLVFFLFYNTFQKLLNF